jgi:hypothetical protein
MVWIILKSSGTVWVIVIGIAVFILYKFFSALNKDNYDLQSQTLSEKFRIAANLINQSAFSGKGTVTPLDKRSFNIYKDGESQIINFTYGTGHLTITWKYKYFQKEVIHTKQFNEVRNISVFTQQKIAETMISEMNGIKLRHQKSVMQEAGLDVTHQKMAERHLLELRLIMEEALREVIVKAVLDVKQLPEMLQGVVAMEAAGNFCTDMKNRYYEFKSELADKNVDFGLTEQQYRKFIDDISVEVLGEFIELPDQQN